MRTQALAPSQPDVTVHIVPNDFGPLGRAYVRVHYLGLKLGDNAHGS